jgi:hypothetical protein
MEQSYQIHEMFVYSFWNTSQYFSDVRSFTVLITVLTAIRVTVTDNHAIYFCKTPKPFVLINDFFHKPSDEYLNDRGAYHRSFFKDFLYSSL